MWEVSIDVGGTFTDLVATDGAGWRTVKVPTTPSRPDEAVLDSLRLLFDDIQPTDVAMVTHATTIATNSLFGQTRLELPPTALVATAGFEDVLEIGRQNRPSIYDLSCHRPRPLVPRDLRFGVRERTSHDGAVIEMLDVDSVVDVASRLVDRGVRDVAVCLMNSYANDSNEREVGRTLSSTMPGARVTLSCDVSPGHREYERTSTTVIDASLRPVIDDYFRRISEGMVSLGVGAPLMIVKSDGGLGTIDDVSPAGLVESGPAAGVIGATAAGTRAGRRRVLTFDMGGTTAKAGASRDGVPDVVHEYEVGGDVHVGRVVKGSGYPVRFPFIDLAECSAGGGSIARVEDGGLRVGPTSAGADPGPACYRRGGTDPTITDANLLLRRLPERLARGLRLDVRLAEDAMRDRVAAPLGIDPIDAALDVVDVADATMSRILRIVTVERGEDPREHLFVAFGGAGPLHACALADGLGIGEVMVPMRAGLLSAVGQLSCPHTWNGEEPVMALADGLDVERTFERLQGEASEAIEDGVVVRQLDMRYVGQSHELTIDMRGDARMAVDDFKARHLAQYGHAPDASVEVVNARVRASSCRDAPSPSFEERPWGTANGHRDVVFRDGVRRCPVMTPEDVGAEPVPGPMVVDGYGSTLLVPEGWDLLSVAGDLMVRRCG